MDIAERLDKVVKSIKNKELEEEVRRAEVNKNLNDLLSSILGAKYPKVIGVLSVIN